MSLTRSIGAVHVLGLASCVWMMSLTRSIGAVHVLAMAPEMPPARKSVTKEPPMASALCPACAVVRVRRAAASSSRGAAGRAQVGQTTCGGVWYRRAGGARRTPCLHDDVARCAAVDPRSGGTGEEADFGLFYAAFAVGPHRRREAMTAPRQVEEQCAGGLLFCVS